MMHGHKFKVTANNILFFTRLQFEELNVGQRQSGSMAKWCDDYLFCRITCKAKCLRNEVPKVLLEKKAFPPPPPQLPAASTAFNRLQTLRPPPDSSTASRTSYCLR